MSDDNLTPEQWRAKAVNLQLALDDQRRISVAMGVLLERYKLTEDAAFGVLRRISQARNLKLRGLADDLVLYGTLDGLDDAVAAQLRGDPFT